MRAKDIAGLIESFAPLSLQASWDNSGFVVGDSSREPRGVLLAVDVTPEVIDEALELGADMIITHHPIIFNPIKRLTSTTYVEQCVERAIKSDIILYAAHTNLDSAPRGMSWYLAKELGVESLEVLSTTSADSGVGFGVVGELAQQRPMVEYIEYVGKRLGCSVMRHSHIVGQECRRVAICTGSGGSLLQEARDADVDLYITADLRYNDFMTPSGAFVVLDVGHFESEYCAINILFDILSKKMINFALHTSRRSRNPVNYISL